MEIGNEKQNEAANQSAGVGTKRQGQWKAVCGPDQRFYFVNLETNVSQWLPPEDLWSSKFGLPYGWEAGITNTNVKYYINHAKKISTLEDPRSEEEQASTHLQMAATRARKVQIKRDPSLGFGFVAGSEKPVVIRSVISGGPSYGKLFSNDQILKVNGKDVSEVPQEHVINLIKACKGELEIHVVSSEDLQDAKNQGQRRSSLMSRATRERRRSSPVTVRFADDMVQYIGPAEQARRASLPALPNVLKVFLENGQTRSFHYNPKTTVQEIFNALGPKLDIKAMEYFCLVLSGPQKNQLSFLQNHEKVSEIYLNRNCSRSSWVCKLRICFVPQDPNEILEKDPVAFDYLYDQMSRDIVEGLFEIDLRYDLAIKLAALHMQQKATEAKHKMPTKISVKSIEKDFDGLEHFLPENIINGVKLKDLRKVLEQQIKFNQTLAGLGQRYLTSKECKKQYLMLASELVSYGGKYFNVVLYSNEGGTGSGGNTKARKLRHQEATVLVSPKYGLSQMVKGKINVLCQLAELEQISDFSISFHAEGKRLLTVTMADNKDLVLLLKPLDSMDLVTFIVGYQKLWNCTTAKLTIKGEKQEPLAPLTDQDIPIYTSLHRVIPDTWSYPSFLQVPGSNSDHHFNLDLTKEPDKYTPSNAGAANEPLIDISKDADCNHIATKRSSEEINALNETDEEIVPSEFVSGKRLKVDNSGSSNEQGIRTSLESEEDTDMVDSPRKTRTLYSIAEESQNLNNEGQEPDEDDYIAQLTKAEEIWRRNRNERIEMSLETSSNESGKNSQDFGRSNNTNSDEIKKSNIIRDNNIESERDGELDRTIVDDADSVEETEHFHDGKRNSSDEGTNNHKLTSEKYDETGESEQEVSLNFSKKDHVAMNELQQGRSDELLDINDIDFDDDHSDTSENDSIDLLADFSFAGDINLHENGSPVDTKTKGVLKYEDTFQHDDDDDDKNDHEDHNIEDTVDLPQNETTFLSNVVKDYSIDGTLAFKKKPDQKIKERDKSSAVDKSISGDTLDSLTSQKTSSFDKKGNNNFGDSGESDFENNFKEYTLSNATFSKEEKNKSLDENKVDEVGIQLLSCNKREDQDILVTRRSAMSNETKDFNEELSVDGSGVEGDYRLEGKDSDLSSLSSQGSWHFTNTVDDPSQDSRLDGEEQNKNSDLNVNSSSDEMQLLDESDTKHLVKTKEKVSDENKVLSSQSYLNKIGGHETQGVDFLGRIDLDDEDHSQKTSGGISKVEGIIENVDDVTTKDLKNTEGEPSPIVLLLGNDPGESEDTFENFDKNSFGNNEIASTKDEIDFQEYSLMDWIIPPPPGSTEELLDSDISVASPPPTSPTFEPISSPPVELNDGIFNELEIDGMIVPPPPMGSSFSSVIRVVSPPPSHAKCSIQKEKPTSTGNYEYNMENNRQQLDNLKLEDSRNVVRDEFVPMNLAQSRSSESSGSIFTDDYNSGSTVSCYSLSNDSQRTSEDEFFEEESTEIPEEFEDRSVGNAALIKLLEPVITNHELEDVRLNFFEDASSFKKTQPNESIMEIQQEGTDEQKISVVDGESVSGHNKSDENDTLEVIDQDDTDVPRNGLSYENDYDCLDEVLFTVGNGTLSNEGFKGKSDVPELSQYTTVSRSTQKNNKQLFERTEKLDGPVRLSEEFEKPNVEESSSEVGYAKHSANWLSRQGKPFGTTDRTQNNLPTLLASKVKENDNKKEQIVLIDTELKKTVDSRNLNEKAPKSLLNPSVAKQTTSVFLPGYKELNDAPSGISEMNLPSSYWTLESESEAATDEDQSPQFQRKAQSKRTMNQKIPTQHRKDTAYDGGKLDVSSSDESVKNDGAGAVHHKLVGENYDDLDDESSFVKRSCLSAKIETADLSERLKIRLQGCVDDCQNSALKSSYLPFANSNKWKEGVHDNAVLLGSDIKVLNKNVQEMNSNLIPAIKASLETLQSLVSSFVLASTSQQRISLYSVRMLAGILNDVISLYNDVIIKIEEAVRLYPNKSKLDSVAEKTSSMTVLIASLRRTLKRL